MTIPVEELLAEAPAWLLILVFALILDHVLATATRRHKP